MQSNTVSKHCGGIIMKFLDNVVIITGAARGIGAACAWTFAKRGAIAVIVDIDGENGEKTASDIRAQSLKAISITTDISKSSEVSAMVELVLQKYKRIDILVNNAFFGGGYALITETSEEMWDRANAVNMKGSFLCAKMAAKTMIAQKSGKIINISSGAGIRGSLSQGVQYSASKAGIIGLTKGLAGDLAPFGINVNCIAPGLIQTKAILAASTSGWTQEKISRFIDVEVPMGRVGRPEDIAETVVFLASEAASYITGEIISVDGGALLNTVAKREALLGF